MCYVGDVWSWVPVLFWYFQGAASVAIALFALVIARQQKRTEALSSKLNLFDRRFRVFLKVRSMLSSVESANEADFLKFRTGAAEAYFIFEPEIEAWIHEIYLHGIKLSSARRVRKLHPLERGDDWDPAKNAQTMFDEETWLGSQLEIAKEKFLQYLDVRKL